jgi:2-polyprenyl-3-methyl-5-hydroxy-6-metoxy-1,4-benzoquinol methylase
LLVLVTAFNAQQTLKRVLDRLPAGFLAGTLSEVLILDDASHDETFEVGLAFARRFESSPMTVLRNPSVQQYGGNLKLGFEYAIQNGFDAVVMLHGDGKYAPECLPAILEPILADQADVVVGSRMIDADGDSWARLPLYKRVGNRVMTWLQNRMIKARLSDWHSAYRAYSVGALRGVPFQLNSDDLEFDSEILIQLLRGGFRVAEVPIPAYHGELLAYNKSLAYAWAALATTVAAVLHTVGIKHRRKYDLAGGPPEYSIKLGYRSSHTMAIESVPSGSRVLDVGCGRGFVARELLAKGCTVVGLDQVTPCPEWVSRSVRWRLDDAELPERASDFDVLLLLDILEHVPNPEGLLDTVRRQSNPRGPAIVLTAPNVGFLPIRLMLLLGQFNYGKEGILDFTHTRLFTFASLKSLLQQHGYEIEDVRGVPAPYPKAIGDTALARFLVRMNAWLIALWPSLFAYQIFLRIRPYPTVDHLLDDTIRHSVERTTAQAGAWNGDREGP